MKLTVIGLGQCGSRIADQFARLNSKARRERKAVIAPNIIAVNADQADLTGLKYIQTDHKHRILIGLRQTHGHGVGKLNELGAELARADGDKIVDAIKSNPYFYQTHAFLLIAGTGGGTGSGSLPVVAQMIKERYINKPLFVLAVLPFEHEQDTESRTLYNTATCLKSTYDIVDAVFLADNQRYVEKDASLVNNIEKINRQIAEPFYDLMCAGEVTQAKHVGTRTVDGGDIMASLEGWTAISTGRVTLPSFRFPWEINKKHFRDKALESSRGTQALEATVGDMSVSVNPKDAGLALYLTAGPAKEMSMDMVQNVSGYIKEIAPQAVIRGGDFPGEKHFIDVTLILSQLAFVPRIKEIYEKATIYGQDHQVQLDEIHGKIDALAQLGKDLPTL